jgi:diguanylate cyclase (GGDEF)-like protein
MLQLDVLSSFAISGAGALVAAGMLRPALAHDEAGAEALGICRAGYALVGIGLVQPVALDLPLPLWSQAVMAFGSVSGVLMIGWALAALAGERTSRLAIGLALAAVAALVLAALPAGTRGITIACTLGLAAASLLTAWLGRRLVGRPRDVHERLIGAAVALMVISCTLRVSYLLTWDGPYESHLLHVPPMMVTPYVLMYGVLPVVFATLLFNVISARIQGRLLQRATTDQLTGAHSRHALAEGAATLISRTRRGGGQLAVIMLDIDHFKRINDQHGHAGGDTVLRHVAQVLQGQLRADALTVRYGGEEFVALTPVPDLPLARRVAERMREAIEAAPWPQWLPGLEGLTASVGVTLLDSDETLEQALSRADEALYRAKHGGRNQVQVGLAAA